MQLPKKECTHIAQILKESKQALLNKDSIKLKTLSNQTIHSACSFQDEASITIGILLYALGKIIERSDYKRIKSWQSLIKKFNSSLDQAISAISRNKIEEYQRHVQQARKVLESQSINIKPYISSILKKAAINKGSKIHAHGISLEQTARLLGTSQWELSEYIGQRIHEEKKLGPTINTKTRAKMALEFFQ